MKKQATIDSIEVETYRIPTEQTESDGTYSWNATTLVVVHLSGGGATGLGYTCACFSKASSRRCKGC